MIRTVHIVCVPSNISRIGPIIDIRSLFYMHALRCVLGMIFAVPGF